MNYNKLKRKIFFTLSTFCLITLNSCVQSTTSLFGPAVTAAKTGNVYNAGITYTSNNIIKEQLGKTPSEYVTDLILKDIAKDKSRIKKNTEAVEVNKTITLTVENNNNEYNQFISAVKKILK